MVNGCTVHLSLNIDAYYPCQVISRSNNVERPLELTQREQTSSQIGLDIDMIISRKTLDRNVNRIAYFCAADTTECGLLLGVVHF